MFFEDVSTDKKSSSFDLSRPHPEFSDNHRQSQTKVEWKQFVQHCINSDWIQVILIDLSKGFFDALFLNEGEFLQAYRSTGLRRAILPIQLCTLLVTMLFLQVLSRNIFTCTHTWCRVFAFCYSTLLSSSSFTVSCHCLSKLTSKAFLTAAIITKCPNPLRFCLIYLTRRNHVIKIMFGPYPCKLMHTFIWGKYSCLGRVGNIAQNARVQKWFFAQENVRLL